MDDIPQNYQHALIQIKPLLLIMRNASICIAGVEQFNLTYLRLEPQQPDISIAEWASAVINDENHVRFQALLLELPSLLRLGRDPCRESARL